MKGSWVFKGIIIALLVLGLGNAVAVADPLEGASFVPNKNLLLIGWDGVQYDHMLRMLRAGRLPNLAHIQSTGSLVHVAITDHETCTKPGWTQICTGLKAADSGVFSNSKFRPVPAGATVFEKLEELSGRGIFTAFIASKSHHLGSLGPGIISDRKSRQGEPWMNAKGNFDIWYGDMGRNGDLVLQTLLNVLDRFGEKNRFAIFTHFRDPDQAGHQSGEGSPEYEDAIANCDLWLGSIRTYLKEHALLQDTVLVVVTDHGFDKNLKTHRHAPDAFFAVNNYSQPCHDGNMLDVAPTLMRLLAAPKDSYAKLPGASLCK